MQLLVVATEAIVLYALSRLLFSWAMRALAVPRPGGGALLQFLRLPGNLIHELGHAIGYWACGYRVRRLVPCVFDKQGRGTCQRGEPWAPVAVPWLATGIASLLPLVFGTIILRSVVQALGVELHPMKVIGDNMGGLLVSNIVTNVRGLDWGAWQTYVFLYLAFSIGAELAPSDVDLWHAVPAILASAAGCVVMVASFSRVPTDAPVRIWFEAGLGHGIAWLTALLDFGILTALTVGAVIILPATLIRVVRGR